MYINKQCDFNSPRVRKQRIKLKRKHVEPVIVINEDAQTYTYGFSDEKCPREYGRIEIDPITEKQKFIPIVTNLTGEVFTNG